MTQSAAIAESRVKSPMSLNCSHVRYFISISMTSSSEGHFQPSKTGNITTTHNHRHVMHQPTKLNQDKDSQQVKLTSEAKSPGRQFYGIIERRSEINSLECSWLLLLE